jgi:peptidoglycan/LPS O-acetylase OafA/YrhL
MQQNKTLDGIRGLAIIWVLLYHFFSLPPKNPFLANIPVLSLVSSFGWAGVSLFFMLSGYLITKGLIQSDRESAWFKRFWCRRLFRIIPLYALLLLAYGVAKITLGSRLGGNKQWFGEGIPFWSFLVFVQNFYMASRDYLGNDWLRVTWSLAVEMQFYLFISLLIGVIPVQRLGRWILFFILGSLLFRYIVFFTHDNSQMALIVLLPSRLDAFLLGALLVLLTGYFDRQAFIVRHARSVLLVIVASSVAFVLLLGSGKLWGWSESLVPLYHFVIALGCSALMGLATGPGAIWLKKVLQTRPLIASGKVSYFLYLFHLPVCMLLFYGILGQIPNLISMNAMLVMLLAIIVSYGLAALSFIYLEGPLIAFSKTLYQHPDELMAKAVARQ